MSTRKDKIIMKLITKHSFSFFTTLFLVLNLLNSTLLTSGVFNDNLDSFRIPFFQTINGVIGNIATLLLIVALSLLVFRTNKGKMRFLLTFTFIFSLVATAISVFSSIFSTFFAYSHLVSFKNPTLFKFIIDYAVYAIGITLRFNQLVYFAPYFILLGVFHWFSRLQTPTRDLLLSSIQSKRQSAILVTLSIIVMATTSIIYQATNRNNIYFLSGNPQHASQSIGTYNYYLSNGLKTLLGIPSNIILNGDEDQTIDDFLNQYRMTNPEVLVNEFTNLADNMNLVIIQMEAINNFVIGLKINGIEVTPNLNALVQDSVYFNNFYATAGIGNTSDAEFSSMTGLYPMGQNFAVFENSGLNYDSLPKKLKNIGYETFSLHGNIGEFYARNTSHLVTFGFDAHYDIDHFNPSYYLNTWIPDDEFLLETVDIIQSYSGKFFAFPITISVHSPFLANEHIPTFDFAGVDGIARRYLHSVRYLDHAIGQFVEKMKTVGLYDNTVFAFFGDHTSSLFKPELTSIFKAGGLLSSNHLNEFDYRREMGKVPFIIHAPSILTPRTIELVRGTVDIYPTFANLFGVTPDYMFGIDALSTNQTYIYNPRNLDLFFDGYMISAPSKKIYYYYQPLNVNYHEAIYQFERFKYRNDLLIRMNAFE
jgi:lipoteichoic acid synthase